ncbi:MAG: UDP-N-acetylmuramoyl-L-alanine--D-glutamate ligase [Rhodococcus sp. (in: high G+C Gram-positive bacteria)]|uniref:UDP-N-acetylmuramoyl-L-alanine--D-glutamate ligase n=1 Tax=Rhodococcus sp. TaxID=1831 RepID=UPI003BAE37AE
MSQEQIVELGWLRGRSVLVTGAGVSGRATIEPLHDLGALVTVADANPEALAECARMGAATTPIDDLLADRERLADFALVVTSPGFRPDAPILSVAAGDGIPIWGDIEFSWYVDQAGIYGPPRQWLVVTGTNGKTTTTSMLQSILDAAEHPSVACGNIGLPVLDALRESTPRAEVLAVELSSFQLHWAPSVVPAAGAVLNIAEDHLDWHGGMQPYIDAKSRALCGEVAVVGLDDEVASSLASSSPAGRTVGFRLGVPAPGELGIEDGYLVDRAFADGARLAHTEGITPPGPAGLMDALAAAALARAIGVAPDAVAAGLANHVVGPHRAAYVADIGGVTFIDDSKATNPHAARPSILAHERVVWIAGGLLKGASVDELVHEVADRLAGAVLLGRDADRIAEALARHAPEVPVVSVETGDDAEVIAVPQTTAHRVVLPPDTVSDALMEVVVREAAALAEPGDVVVLAPAAASLDMVDSYGHRGRSFVDAVGRLRESDISGNAR